MKFRTYAVSFILVLLLAPLSFGQPKTDKKKNKLLLKVKTWKVIKIHSSSSCGIIVGQIIFRFNRKTNDAFLNELKIQLLDSDDVKIFGYKLESDSLKFHNTREWNDFKIESLSKEKLILKHKVDDYLWTWILIPRDKK